MDTALNEFMRPLFSHEPEEMKRRLRSGFSNDCTKILVGQTGTVVTILEYLYEEKYNDIMGMLKDLMRKQSLPMYQRNPERLEVYLQGAAKRIIERALEK